MELKEKIISIIKAGKTEIKSNIKFLADEHKKMTGRKICTTCPASINYMILNFKNLFNMVEFRFTKPNAQYKNKKGDRTTISNSTMTNEKAIEFLRTNPERIRLFSKKPKNWKKLIEGEDETKEEKEARLEAEAEATAVAEAEATANGREGEGELEKELKKLTLSELREKYPEIKATSVKAFIEKVLAK